MPCKQTKLACCDFSGPCLRSAWSRTRKPQWNVAYAQVDAGLWPMLATFFRWLQSKTSQLLSAMQTK